MVHWLFQKSETEAGWAADSLRGSQSVSAGCWICAPTYGQRSGWCSVLYQFEINRCLCCAVTLSRASAWFQPKPWIKSISQVPQSVSDIQNTQLGVYPLVRGSQSSQNKQRSKEWDQWWPGAQDTPCWLHTVGHTVGDNTRHKLDSVMPWLPQTAHLMMPLWIVNKRVPNLC